MEEKVTSQEAQNFVLLPILNVVMLDWNWKYHYELTIFFFWSQLKAGRILVPQSRIKVKPPAVQVWNFNP